MKCAVCGKELTRDEKGISFKLISRAAKDCRCLQCLSAGYGVTVEQLKALIEKFRASRCSLFT